MSDSVMDETESEIDMTQPPVQRGIGMGRARGKGKEKAIREKGRARGNKRRIGAEMARDSS